MPITFASRFIRDTRHSLTALLLLIFVMPGSARAEKIRTSVPGLNLNYLTVFSAEERKRKAGDDS